MAQVKPEWGLKHTCPECGAMFYDMKKKVISCPKCSYTLTDEDLKSPLSSRIREKLAAKTAKVEETPEEEDEDLLEDIVDEEDLVDDDFMSDSDDLDDDDDTREVINVDLDEE